MTRQTSIGSRPERFASYIWDVQRPESESTGPPPIKETKRRRRKKKKNMVWAVYFTQKKQNSSLTIDHGSIRIIKKRTMGASRGHLAERKKQYLSEKNPARQTVVQKQEATITKVGIPKARPKTSRTEGLSSKSPRRLGKLREQSSPFSKE